MTLPRGFSGTPGFNGSTPGSAFSEIGGVGLLSGTSGFICPLDGFPLSGIGGEGSLSGKAGFTGPTGGFVLSGLGTFETSASMYGPYNKKEDKNAGI